jgi:hypothetical protein
MVHMFIARIQCDGEKQCFVEWMNYLSLVVKVS